MQTTQTSNDKKTLPFVKILIVDLLTLNDNEQIVLGSEIADYIESFGGVLHFDEQVNVSLPVNNQQEAKTIHFFYLPQLSCPNDIAKLTSQGQYDGVIAAATIIPMAAKFALGGVRIGAGTGNMQSQSFSQGAPLMNTPSFNSQVTAQMVFKAILDKRPKVDWPSMHRQVVAGSFDTGRDLVKYPTAALFGYTIAILGFGHIGREVAKIAQSFGMKVKVYARAKHQAWIESLGYHYCKTAQDAASGADILSPHLGLGQASSNVGFINSSVLFALNDEALVVNFDRAELIDVDSLKKALAANKVAQIVIDADIFVDQQGQCTGPLQPFRSLCEQFTDRLLLLPHVAADIDHLSRVAGAKQAIKQIITAIEDKVVINGVGQIPSGFIDGGKQTIKGIGAVSQERYQNIEQDDKAKLIQLSTFIANFWQHNTSKQQIDNNELSNITLAHNQMITLLKQLGLTGIA